MVLQFEQEKLKRLGIRKEPVHKSVTEGDGLGYDILSYDESGKEIYIEVKTTTGVADTPFYITRNELEKSRQVPDRFHLYRVFDFDERAATARYFIRQGDLSELCGNPILYKALVEGEGASR